jgi:hypothetical protein
MNQAFKTTFLFLIGILCLLLADSQPLEAKPACGKEPTLPASPTLEGCRVYGKRVSDYYSKCSQEGMATWQKESDGAIGDCYKKVMEVELDKRLLPLKKSNPEEFKKEMKLQAEFNNAILDDFCISSDWSAIGGGTAGCYADLTQYRSSQAAAINTHQLVLTGSSPQTKLVRQKALTFAQGLCQLPAEVWKEGKTPSNCVEKVLSEIEKAHGFTPEFEKMVEERNAH